MIYKERIIYRLSPLSNILIQMNSVSKLNNETTAKEELIRSPYEDTRLLSNYLSHSWLKDAKNQGKLFIHSLNIARIANAVQVTICLLVSTNLNLNRCLFSHCKKLDFVCEEERRVKSVFL